MRSNLKVFVLSGKAKSGKDEVANMIASYYGKENVITVAYAYYIKDYLTRMGRYDENDKEKYRTLLQNFSSHTLIPSVGDSFLINRVIDDVKVFSNFYSVVIITDARSVNEIEKPKDVFSNVISIRMERDVDNHLSMDQKVHITETALDAYSGFDYVIENNGTITQLESKVYDILRGVK